MKCKTWKCAAKCCYNVPFFQGELKKYADKVVNKIVAEEVIFGGQAILPWTANHPLANRCPFLRADYRCNIYEQRPSVCRLMAEVPELPCRWRPMKK